MKLDALLALVTPFLAVDAKPDVIKAAILAADKAAKDKAKDEFPDKDKDEPKAKDGDPKDEPKAKDKGAKDKDNDPEGTDKDVDVDGKDNELANADPSTPSKGGKSEKPAMDSAEVDRRIAAAVAARDELHTATREVEPVVGKVAFDSAPKAYRAALDAMHVDLTGIPDSALGAVFKLARDRSGTPSPIAMDSASVAEVAKLIPNYNRL